ncbi:hypothetical protein HNP52_001500 [Sphingomonas kyeonggiensis]|uniref:Uncharacterized protein n=1 Tax=Sphingomonas kyeonggiensis TaxID=1268553 RepID=A0A7W7K030_9SPHN|nr:hypothetical protein [Sphingomonas kyeonggiensis]MBB4838449.1 hypothetical protein [Sphingomonas kyeonggiensis]
MLFRFGLGLAALALTLLAQPGAAQAQTRRPTIQFSDGRVFPFMNLIRFWEANGDQAMGETPNERAPGRIFAKPGVAVLGNVSKADAAVVIRKLTIACDALLALEPLRDVHGSYVMAAITVSRGQYGQVQGLLNIKAYAINLNDPATRVDAGRYSTPGGDGPSLNVWYNAPFDQRYSDRLAIWGEQDGVKILPMAGGYAGLIARADRQLLVPGRNGNVLNPKYLDPSRPAGELQMLWFHAASGWRDRQAPTSQNGRLAAASFMADWGAIVRQMEQVR